LALAVRKSKNIKQITDPIKSISLSFALRTHHGNWGGKALKLNKMYDRRALRVFDFWKAMIFLPDMQKKVVIFGFANIWVKKIFYGANVLAFSGRKIKKYQANHKSY
jgi:hypothetical protein